MSIMKQWAKFDRYDVLVYLLNSPAIIIVNYILFGGMYFQNTGLFIKATLLANVWGAMVFLMLTLWMKFMRYRFGKPDDFGSRLMYSMLMYVAVMMAMMLLLVYCYGLLKLPYKPENVLWVLVIGFVTNVISAGCHEAIFTYYQLRASTKREFELKEMHMQRQMDVLKQQINPHFLFNSLNSLMALIGEDTELAERFVEELSSVYRYVLRANEQNLINLSDELEFIRSYSHLLTTRHGKGFNLTIEVNPVWAHYQLPPLTLQLLVENAVKHNIVMNDMPLNVEIHTDERANLHVSNNLQKKIIRVTSHGVGLSNILTRYQMLGQPTPVIRQEADRFIVAVPLISA
ncbi:sensor histidine kinase [Dyadobacter sediminis]|nr:histidine kinase [Dyadobacter sediminis]GGB96820.1 hypothetical protein GCM10011325_25180 [Dyadobacter sediminis]